MKRLLNYLNKLHPKNPRNVDVEVNSKSVNISAE
jgi:hypothetical protein